MSSIFQVSPDCSPVSGADCQEGEDHLCAESVLRDESEGKSVGHSVMFDCLSNSL